jgi:hypothetical protein
MAMLKLTQSTTYLLLTLLILTSMNSAFGVVYCECGSSSTIHHENHHTTQSHQTFCEDYAVQFNLQLKKNDSCRDILLGLEDGVIKKESVHCSESAIIYFFPEILTASVSTCLPVLIPFPKSPPEISQNILVHRTVVLLI